MSLTIQEQIIALWAVFLFGTIFHTQLALMPQLYGASVAIPHYKGKTPVSHLWGMLGFFALPMIAIVATALNASPLYRIIHFGLTVFYTVMNFLHVALDLRVKPIEWYQIVLVTILFINGIVLNVIAFQWMQYY
ncbi:MAG: hypothetical protein QNJ55_21900 [Xenococcus sp. MO_188.B8]|nr:hypothetical protein [Xenococcus sp. MO_188.B8]